MTIIRKIRNKIWGKLVDYIYSPKKDDHKQRTLKHRNKPNESKSTNHKPRPFELVQVNLFPKKSDKVTDGTEKPKIPLKFANYAAQYNEFGSNIQSF